MSINHHLIIYTDGSARGNPGPGGYGIVLIWGDVKKEISGGYRLTTNNRMELMAVIVALQSLKKKNIASKNTIEQVQHVLKKAAEIGSAKLAKNPYFTVSGKTGTAQVLLADQKSYKNKLTKTTIDILLNTIKMEKLQEICMECNLNFEKLKGGVTNYFRDSSTSKKTVFQSEEEFDFFENWMESLP